jgi:methanogenic corrinoid protein MtbC1
MTTSSRGDPLEEYFRSLTDVDAFGATDLVLGLLDEGTPVERITAEVLVPAQIRVGQMWEQGKWSVADEHAATAVTETALLALSAAAGRRHRGGGRHVVVACGEGEWHTLPARMASTVAASSDARVTVLGPSLPAEHLGRRMQAGDVDLLALSCTMPTNLIGAARSIGAAHEAGVPVIVGGRAFGGTAQRAHAIGADAWAAEAAALLVATPELAGRSSSVPSEVLTLDAVSETTVTLAYERMAAAFPRLSQMSPLQQARTREDFKWMARFTAATLLTGDVTILDDFLSWLCGLLSGRVPTTVIVTSAHLIADALEPDAPNGAELLRGAAARIERQTNEQTG